MTEVVNGSNGSNVSATGNTKNSSARNTSKYRWFFTMKVFNEKEWETEKNDLYQNLAPLCKEFIFQMEKGASEYLHFQGCCSLTKKMRLQELKTHLPKEIHLEGVKNWADSWSYCSKSLTRIQGPFKYPEEFQYTKACIDKLYPWQEEVVKIIKKKKDDRKIYWFYEPNGNMGKSTFCNWLYDHNFDNKSYIILDSAKKADLFYAFSGGSDPPKNYKPPDVVLFDFSRTMDDKISYEAIECLLNGRFLSTKYESRMFRFNPPLVLCFANFNAVADRYKLSADRWSVFLVECGGLTAEGDISNEENESQDWLS